MKILFCLFKYYPFGGLERDFMRIAKACAEKGHQIHVFTMIWDAKKPENFHIHLTSKQGLSNHQRAKNFGKKLQKHLQQNNYDVVVGFNRMPELDIYFAADICFQKLVQQKHGTIFKFSNRYRSYLALEKAVFAEEAKTQILYLTENELHDYQQFYNTPKNRFHYIPAGIKRSHYSQEQTQQIRKELQVSFHLNNDNKLILMVGSDFKRKGVDRALRAFAALPQQQKETTRLFIIGKGKAKAYEKLIQELNINKQVKFLGGRDDVERFMLAADILIHPAYFETAGMVLLEALTFGLPVLVTGNCGYAFHIEKANAGIVIPMPFSQESLNHALETMLTTDTSPWRENALRYATETDLYSMSDKAVEYIEQFARN